MIKEKATAVCIWIQLFPFTATAVKTNRQEGLFPLWSEFVTPLQSSNHMKNRVKTQFLLNLTFE